MDPTWSTIVKIEKYYELDDKGRRIYKGKVKIPSRTYFDASGDVFFDGRSCIHPAFYLSDTVYSYRTVRKKVKHRLLLKRDYSYESVLDSLMSDPLYAFSKSFLEEVKLYYGKYYFDRYFSDQWDFLELKRTSYNRLTSEECDKHLEDLKVVLDYIKKEHGEDFTMRYLLHKEEVEEKREKLLRREQLSAGK